MMISFLADRSKTVRIRMGWAYSILLLVFAGAFYSVAPTLSFAKAVFFVPLICYLAFPGSFVRSLYHDERAQKLFLIGLCSILGVITFLQISGGFMSPNGLGALGVSVLPFAMAVRDGNTRLKWVVSAAVVFLIVASFSRSCALAAIFCTVTYYQLRKGRTSSIPIFKILASSILVIGAISYSGIADAIIYKDGDELFDDARQQMVEEVSEAVWQSPLLGWGFGLSWRFTAEDVLKVQETGRLSLYVGEFGNLTFALIGSGGLTLVFLFYGWMLSIIRSAINSLREIESQHATMPAVAISGMVGLLVLSQGEAALISPFSIMSQFFWLYVGLANYCTYSVDDLSLDTSQDEMFEIP